VAAVPTVPGVYFEPKPRFEPPPAVRTDVAGFIGFETRVRDGSTPSALAGTPVPSGHGFRVDVPAFEVAIPPFEATAEENRIRVNVPPATDFVLSQSNATPLLNDGESVVFALAVAAPGIRLLTVAGVPVAGPQAAAPGDVQLAAAVNAEAGEPAPFARLADIDVFRDGDDARLRVVNRNLHSRITNGTLPSAFIGGPPPTGHEFRIDIAAGDVAIQGDTQNIPTVTNFMLSASMVTTLLAPGERVIFSLVAIRTGPRLVSLMGAIAPAPGPVAGPPGDSLVAAAVRSVMGGGHRWVRLANVEYIRAGSALRMAVRPALPPAACNDYRDYVKFFGEPRRDGFFLARAVKAFFSNGARRCWIATVRAVRDGDTLGLAVARDEMLGLEGASEEEATGLERLILIEQVSIIDVPDLYARRSALTTTSVDLPPPRQAACFTPCDPAMLGTTAAPASQQLTLLDPLYADAEVLDLQRRMVTRLMPERWRALLLLTAPLEFDGSTGRFAGPSRRKALDWRNQFAGLGEEDELSVAAMYFPWLLNQEQIDAEVVEMPPTPFAAGVIARRDLTRGPAISPANETVRAVVGLTSTVDDDVQTALYAPPANINVFRPFPGYGIQLWGARTLSAERYLRYLSVRRCLTAIERRVHRALQGVVFEPHTPLLWFRVTQPIFEILLSFFNQGALLGAEPREAFYVRCDASNNTRETVLAGELHVEVGVAIAAPAEFIVFRIGRREGVVEVVE
jgi:hypothetical protein